MEKWHIAKFVQYDCDILVNNKLLFEHKQLELKKTVLDRMVHLFSKGYVLPVVAYITSSVEKQDTDISLIRHFVMEVINTDISLIRHFVMDVINTDISLIRHFVMAVSTFVQ